MARDNGALFMDTGLDQVDVPQQTTTQPLKQDSRDSFATHSSYQSELLDEFADMDADCLLEEAAIVVAQKPKMQEVIEEQPPALPQKSSLRTSRILDSLKLSSIESATQSLANSHDVYMSSEEDASSSADEFSDYDWDSSSESSGSGSPVTRKSYEDTARVVSVVFSGKPSIVELSAPKRPATPSRTESTSSEADSFHTATTESTRSADSRAPRPSSLDQQPSFLQNDPFPSNRDSRLDDSPRKTSGTFGRVQRTFSLVRKRSRPFLRTSIASTLSREDVTLPGSSSSLNLSFDASSPERELASDSPVDLVKSPQSPVSYNEIIRASRLVAAKNNAITALPPISPLSPIIPKRGLLTGLKSRRRSLRS